MRLTMIVLIVTISGCTIPLNKRYDPKNDIPDGRAMVELIGQANLIERFELVNRSKFVLEYAHWFGMDKTPVAFALATRQKFLSAAGRLLFLAMTIGCMRFSWPPGESIKFDANIRMAKKVGVKFFAHVGNGLKETYIWSDPL